VALTFLVDTSVLKRLRHPEVRVVLEPLANRGALGRPSICDLEIGYSARNAAEWDRLLGALEAFAPIDTTASHVRRALQVQRLLAERSQRGRKYRISLWPPPPRSSPSASFTTTPTSISSRRSPANTANGSFQPEPSTDGTSPGRRPGSRWRSPAQKDGMSFHLRCRRRPPGGRHASRPSPGPRCRFTVGDRLRLPTLTVAGVRAEAADDVLLDQRGSVE
jgi:predicted nucleic acid-binding protein